MWTGATIFVRFIVLAGLVCSGFVGNASQKSGRAAIDQTRWIANALQEIQSVQVNMKRRDLARVFTTEGGLSTRSSRVYVYKKCPYIKVKFDFQPAQGSENLSRESEDDRITKISKPYLEYPLTD
jgi:hypothetical protein